MRKLRRGKWETRRMTTLKSCSARHRTLISDLPRAAVGEGNSKYVSHLSCGPGCVHLKSRPLCSADADLNYAAMHVHSPVRSQGLLQKVKYLSGRFEYPQNRLHLCVWRVFAPRHGPSSDHVQQRQPHRAAVHPQQGTYLILDHDLFQTPSIFYN